VSDNAANMKKAFNMTGVIERLNSHQWVEEVSTTIESESDHDDDDAIIIDEEKEDSDSDEASSIDDSTADVFGLGWLGCLAHWGQCAINDALKTDPLVLEVLNTLNKIIVFFRRSNKWEAIYRKEVEEVCKCVGKTGHELKAPNSTRWNSTLFAIERMAKANN
jgi:hypothetical protein